MKVTNDTLFATFQPIIKCLKSGEVEKIKQAAPVAVIGAGGYYDLTIAQWNAITAHNDLSCISEKMTDPLRCSVYEYYCAMGLADFIKSYCDALKNLTLSPDAKEQAAQRQCKQMTPTEGLLIFARKYFGLHSFRDAEQVTLGELLLAKKDAYNEAAFQKAYSKQMSVKK